MKLYFFIFIKFYLFLTSDISHKMFRGDWNKGSIPNVANTCDQRYGALIQNLNITLNKAKRS